jgi:NADH-quinone oxidoreductase subunit E
MGLADKYAERIEKTLAKYPDKRSAVMPLLYIAQEEYGWVNQEGIDEVAAIIEMDPTQVKSIAGFYTMYSEKPKGRYWLQVCTDLPCALRGADQVHRRACDVPGRLRQSADAPVQLSLCGKFGHGEDEGAAGSMASRSARRVAVRTDATAAC